MSIRNNNAANLVLGEWKKNDSKLAKDLKRAASGTKLTSAGDGASEYSISEKMRVRIRALGQADDNVLTGASLLRVAEGGIQQQVDILRTIKQKVIDANNDTNTDLDRATIQKEIDQGYDQMQDIATETTYNGKRILFGGDIEETVRAWQTYDTSHFVLDSDSMGVIPDKYDVLNGISGPFDIFKEYGRNYTTIPLLNLNSNPVTFTSGTTGTPAVYEVSFANYTSVAALDGVGIQLGNQTFALTTTPSKNYTTDNVVDISSCTTVTDVLQALVNQNNKLPGNLRTFQAAVSSSGTSILLTTQFNGTSANQLASNIKGTSATSSTTPSRAAVAGTGLLSTAVWMTGGADASTNPNDPDAHPAAYATATVDFSTAAAGTGFRICGPSSTGSYEDKYSIKLVSGTQGLAKGSDGIYTLGLDANISNGSLGGMNYSMKNGVFTLKGLGSSYNSYFLVDTIPAVTSKTYEALTGWNGTTTLQTASTADTPATYTLDLSNVPNTTSTSDLESVISQIKGKALETIGGSYYEFIDSGNSRSIDGLWKFPGSSLIDLNTLRSAVSNGKTVRDALSDLIYSSIGSNFSATQDANGNIELTSKSRTDALRVVEGQLNSYDVDYGTWFQNNSSATIPDALYGKGFRFYCATDSEQWFNIVFTNGDEFEKSRPKSGTSAEDIRTITVDVSKVTSAADLVNAIYDQANPYFTNLNHYYHLAVDEKNGILTIYDDRRDRLSNNSKYPDYQEKGAKIADGMYDNVDKSTRDILIDDLVIQNTDHASQNIHIHIPRTTLDQVFAYRMDSGKISDYNVLTKDMREQLLGNPPENPGILDRGLEYLTSGLTLIGAQQNHLSHSHDNLTTQNENVTASESTIRDADMAKTMTDYARDNILSQSAQAMLAQANQSASSVLSLLQ